MSSSSIADDIQRRFGVVVDDRKVRSAIERMREGGWPIETTPRGSCIPPSKRPLLPEIYRK